MSKNKEFHNNEFSSKVLSPDAISQITSSMKLTLVTPKREITSHSNKESCLTPIQETYTELEAAKDSALKDIGDPNKILEAIKTKIKTLSKATAKVIRDTIPSLDRPLRSIIEALESIGLGSDADELLKVSDKLIELKRKVDDGKITKASVFKEKTLPLLKSLLDFEIDTDYLDSLKEGKEKLKDLKWKSLSEEAKRHGKQPAFFFQAPVVISGYIHRNTLTRLSPYWDIQPVLKSGYVIKEVNFLALKLDKVQKGSAEDLIKGLIKRVNEQATNPVLPFFDVTIEGPKIMAVMLLPEREARSAVKVLQQSHVVYIKA